MDSIVSILVGAIGVPVVNFLKTQFNLSGKAAFVLTMAVAVALAAVQLFLTGGLTGDNLLANFALIFSAATAIYKLLG